MDTAPKPDLRSLDEQYVPFPPFADWNGLEVDSAGWSQNQAFLKADGADNPELLSKARDVAKKAAAIDSGAIEGLYEVDGGFTITIAAQFSMWQAAYEKKTEETRRLIEAQMAGYDEVIDLATKGAPMAEAWIRGLHKVICSAQKTYRVLTEQGQQDQQLPLGEYKKNPNHVMLADKSVFAYAPVWRTEEEMRRFLTEITSDAFSAAHPILQMAYAHYAFVRIHPFADGNGRTARALASVFSYRATSIPFMVLVEHKQDYLGRLRRADKGDYQAFVDFVSARSIEAFQMVGESLRAARYTLPEVAASYVKKLHVTAGGYSHRDIDHAGALLVKQTEGFCNELAQQLVEANKLAINVAYSGGSSHAPPRKGLRGFANPASHLQLQFVSPAPAESSQVVVFHCYLPVDAKASDTIVLFAQQTNMTLEIQVDNLIPKLTTTAQLRIRMFLQGLFGSVISHIATTGRTALKKKGL